MCMIFLILVFLCIPVVKTTQKFFYKNKFSFLCTPIDVVCSSIVILRLRLVLLFREIIFLRNPIWTQRPRFLASNAFLHTPCDARAIPPFLKSKLERHIDQPYMCLKPLIIIHCHIKRSLVPRPREIGMRPIKVKFLIEAIEKDLRSV